MKKRIIWLVLIVLALALGWGFQRHILGIQVSGFLDPEQQIAVQGGVVHDWEVITNETWYAHLNPREDRLDKKGLEHLLLTSRRIGDELVSQGVDEFYVGVAFNQYLAPSDFDKLVLELDLEPQHGYMRGTFPNLAADERVQLHVGIPDQKLSESPTFSAAVRFMDSQAREKVAKSIRVARRRVQLNLDFTPEDWRALVLQDGDYRIKGVTAFSVVTDMKGYLKLRDDPRIWYVDVTPTYIYHQMWWRCLCWQEFVQRAEYYTFDFSRDLEDAGMLSFRD